MGFLWSPSGPWIYLGHGEPDRREWIPSYFYTTPQLDDVCVRQLRGWKMRSYEGLMNEFSAALQFFDDFGENWSALKDCLVSLDEWLPASAYVIVIERAEELLIEDPVELEAFLRTITAAGESWSIAVSSPEQYKRPPIPFHVLLNVSDGHHEGIARVARTVDAARTPIPVRTDY
ncbi:barstar family protein [Microbacterium sp.]|nr:barstar family protein [Microbacterium sp.]